MKKYVAPEAEILILASPNVMLTVLCSLCRTKTRFSSMFLTEKHKRGSDLVRGVRFPFISEAQVLS